MKKFLYVLQHWRMLASTLWLVLLPGIIMAAEIDDLRERVDELEEIVETLEKQNASDRILFTSELRAIHHNFDYFAEETETEPEAKEHGVANQLRFRLNMRSDVRNNLRFVGRLTMFKNWGDNPVVDATDLGTAGVPSDTTAKVERAYLDYFMHPRFSLSVGRLAGADGPPSEFAENTPRRSAYPIVTYNIELDGIVGTIHLPSWHPSLRNSAIRLIYGELGTYDSDTVFRDDGADTMGINVVQAETEILQRGLEGLLVFDYLLVENFSLGRRLFEDSLDSTEETLGFPVVITEFPKSFGRISRQSLHTQFKFSSWGIFIYTTYVHTESRGNGKRLVVSSDIPGQPSFPIYCYGLNQSLDCTKADEKVTKNGNAISFGLTYTLPLEKTDPPKIGGEYRQASKDNFGSGVRSNYGPSGSGLDFNYVAGNASHFYWIQPLEPNLFVRAGLRKSNQQYSGDEETNKTLQDVYVLINAEF